MYIDLIVLIVLILVVVMFFKRFSSFVFFMAIIEIFLRILYFIRCNIGLPDVSAVLGKYFPANMFEIIDKYTANIDILNIILKWAFVIIMAILVTYITKIFFNKKKI